MSVALLLTHAAGLLTAEARTLCMSCTPDGNGDWRGEPEAKAHHADLTSTAAGLLALASQIAINQERKGK